MDEFFDDGDIFDADGWDEMYADVDECPEGCEECEVSDFAKAKAIVAGYSKGIRRR